MTAGLIFRTSGPWGAGKGANLTPDEVDGNFWEVIQRIAALEGSPLDPVSISNIVVNGASFSVFLTDATELGPFTLPTAVFSWRGDWQGSTQYFALDVFRVPGDGAYLVVNDFTSGSTFVDDANVELLLDEAAVGGMPVEFGSAGLQAGDILVWIVDSAGGRFEPRERVYDFGFQFGAAPGSLEVIGRVPIGRAIEIPADFSGPVGTAFGHVESNPGAQYDIDVQDDGATIGTISVAANGTVTFSTVGGTAKTVAGGSVVRAVSPDGGSSGPDTAITGFSAWIPAKVL